MNILERVRLTEAYIKNLSEIPTERTSSQSVVNVSIDPLDNTEGPVKKHIAKMTVEPHAFANTFSPDDDRVTVIDAQVFGNIVRYTGDGVIVDCLMTTENLKAYYGDVKLAQVLPSADLIG